MIEVCYRSTFVVNKLNDIYINLVTFFVKIPEMTMARLTNVYFSLVESQKSRVDTG